VEYQKVKSAPKQILAKGPRLSKIVLDTMAEISSIVGGTLGPSGMPVLIERFEHGLDPFITKDGVTVMRSIGFEHAGAQVIYEAARDAATKTATEAGDGTTTATVLSEAIVRRMDEFCMRNRTISKQKIVRRLEEVFATVIEPAIRQSSIKMNGATWEPDPENEGKFRLTAAGKKLRSVARISTNSDDALADAVMECFRLVGDDGNVALLERSGPSSYQVEVIDGFPIHTGYDECCGKFYPAFINDAGAQRAVMENPVFVLYHGVINDIQTILPILQKVGMEFDKRCGRIEGETSDYPHHNVVVVAIGFSERVLASFAHLTAAPDSIKVFPLVVPLSPQTNGQKHFLDDLAAVTGADVFDPLTRPVHTAELYNLGPGVSSFEAFRSRCTIIGRASGQYLNPDEEYETYEDRALDRIDELKVYLQNPESVADQIMTQERLGKLTGGIAKLTVVGSTNGELKEKKDRAEDAVCAVRGAIKHGCLPGGGWMLLKLCSLLGDEDPVIRDVLKPALLEPVHRLLSNCGFNELDAQSILSPVLQGLKDGRAVIYDAYEHRHGDPVELGVLDSTPAVLEAIRNSISIASLLGTLGGYVVFKRDADLERSEARDTQSWLRDANVNEADNRP
jgi:chaperonin GroEL